MTREKFSGVTFNDLDPPGTRISRVLGYHKSSLLICILSVCIYDRQICILGTSDMSALTNRFTSGLTYFSRSQGSRCKNPVLGQQW